MSEQQALSTEVKVGAHLSIRTVNEALTLGKVLFESGYFSDVKSASQAVVKVLAGAELGFGPMASMSGVYVFGGRTAFMANLIASAVQRNGYNYKVLTLTNEECHIEFFGKSGESLGISEFSMKDADVAGLTSGKNAHSWKHYRRNMLFARCMSNGAKWFTPGIFGGVTPYTPDELDMVVDGETGQVVDEPTSGFMVVKEKSVKEEHVEPTKTIAETVSITLSGHTMDKPEGELVSPKAVKTFEGYFVGDGKAFSHANHVKNHVRKYFQVDFLKDLTWRKFKALIGYSLTQQGEEGHIDPEYYAEKISEVVGDAPIDVNMDDVKPIPYGEIDKADLMVRWQKAGLKDEYFLSLFGAKYAFLPEGDLVKAHQLLVMVETGKCVPTLEALKETLEMG